jgi:hypothetical protein
LLTKIKPVSFATAGAHASTARTAAVNLSIA